LEEGCPKEKFEKKDKSLQEEIQGDKTWIVRINE